MGGPLLLLAVASRDLSSLTGIPRATAPISPPDRVHSGEERSLRPQPVCVSIGIAGLALLLARRRRRPGASCGLSGAGKLRLGVGGLFRQRRVRGIEPVALSGRPPPPRRAVAPLRRLTARTREPGATARAHPRRALHRRRLRDLSLVSATVPRGSSSATSHAQHRLRRDAARESFTVARLRLVRSPRLLARARSASLGPAVILRGKLPAGAAISRPRVRRRWVCAVRRGRCERGIACGLTRRSPPRRL